MIVCFFPYYACFSVGAYMSVDLWGKVGMAVTICGSILTVDALYVLFGLLCGLLGCCDVWRCVVPCWGMYPYFLGKLCLLGNSLY